MIEELQKLFPDLKFELFGSRFTGLATENSDWDFVVRAPATDAYFCTPVLVGGQLHRDEGLFGRFVAAGFSCRLGYSEKDPSTAKIGANQGFIRELNPGLHFIAKHPTLPIDVLVLEPEEASRRFRTLSCIRALKDNPRVQGFIQRLKGDNEAYAALHLLIEEAQAETWNAAIEAAALAIEDLVVDTQTCPRLRFDALMEAAQAARSLKRPDDVTKQSDS